jgi:hypothetical protein
MVGGDLGKTKGVGFVNVRAFAVERFGAGGYTAVTERLTPADRAELDSVVPVGWYSLGLYARVIRALDEVHGYGDLSLVLQLGRYEAERDLTTIHRVFLRLANPAYVVEKFGDYWRRFHDSGRWELIRESDTQVSGYLDEWGYVDHALCRELVGYMGRLLELVGARNVVMEHPKCRGRGDARCFFRGRWGTNVASEVPADRSSGSLPKGGDRSSQPSSDEAFAASVELLKADTGKRAKLDSKPGAGDSANVRAIADSSRRGIKK